MGKTLIQAIAATIEAMDNCEQSGNREWYLRHKARMHELEKMLPSGSGFDVGSRVLRWDESSIVFSTAFHHMDDVGHYDGWTEHLVTVRAAFDGITVAVSGDDRDGIVELVADAFHAALTAEV